MKKFWILMLLFAPLVQAEEKVYIPELVTELNRMMKMPIRVSPSIVLEAIIGDDSSMTYVYTMRQMRSAINLQSFELSVRADKMAYACMMYKEGVENLEAVIHEYFDGSSPRQFIIAVTITEADCAL